jgi:hypothetical protein
MDNENNADVITEEKGNEGEGEDSNFVKVSKEEYDKTLSTLGSLKREIKDLKRPKEERESEPN